MNSYQTDRLRTRESLWKRISGTNYILKVRLCSDTFGSLRIEYMEKRWMWEVPKTAVLSIYHTIHKGI